MNALQQLQEWYQIHCDNDWEHDDRITIVNIDNPGWNVTINLSSTLLEDIPFEAQRWGNPEDRENDWLDCSKNGEVFCGMGSSRMLESILLIFLQWADANTNTSRWDVLVSELNQQCLNCKNMSDRTGAIKAMRTIYFQIDDIPNEHPGKAQLQRVFYSVWKELMEKA